MVLSAASLAAVMAPSSTFAVVIALLAMAAAARPAASTLAVVIAPSASLPLVIALAAILASVTDRVTNFCVALQSDIGAPFMNTLPLEILLHSSGFVA